jgi:hypothetical protein
MLLFSPGLSANEKQNGHSGRRFYPNLVVYGTLNALFTA